MTKVPKALVTAVAAAVERLSQDGIDGWGLQVCEDMEAAGELLDLGGYEGCTDTCAHWDHSPAAPTRRWVPRSGTIVYLGYDYRPGDERVVWFAHILDNGEDVRYIELIEPPTEHWASAQYVESVPDWVLVSIQRAAVILRVNDGDAPIWASEPRRNLQSRVGLAAAARPDDANRSG